MEKERQIYSQLPPQDIKAEESVLGAILIDRDAFSIVSGIITDKMFYDQRHQMIFQAMTHLNDSSSPIDFLTVSDQMTKDGTYDKVPDCRLMLIELSGKVFTTSHVEQHAMIIKDKYIRRALIELTSKMTGDSFDETNDIQDLLSRIDNGVFKISAQFMEKGFMHLRPLMNGLIDNIHKASASETGITGLQSGFVDLDKITSGFQNSDFIVVAARPGMGKTSFMLSVAENIGIDFKIPVAIFSLEMDNNQLTARIASRSFNINLSNVRDGNLSQEEWQRLDSKLEDVQDSPVMIDDTAAITMFELQAKCRQLVKNKGVRMIFIDYMQLMQPNGRFNTRQEEVSYISRSLKRLAKELNVPIMALSQLNRAVEMREGIDGKIPVLSDLRESGSIEQDADIVMFLHSPEQYHIYQDEKGNDMRGKTKLIIAKHRNGPTGEITLKFNKELTSFDEDTPEKTASNPMVGEYRSENLDQSLFD